MPILRCEVSQSLMDALETRRRQTGETISHQVVRALADALQLEHSTLFQVSTAGALVEGVSDGAVRVGELSRHGNLGLGTYADLDGEMVLLDGAFYRVRGSGKIVEADVDDLVPFAVVTDFRPEMQCELEAVASLAALLAALDRMRTTPNQFFAVRLAGPFAFLRTRAVCKKEGGARLADAVAAEAEFELRDVRGVIVGFWTPEYAKTVNVAGWHLHFLSDDRSSGGHVLECAGGPLRAAVQHLSDFRMAIPETVAFLTADLGRDPSAALEKAEKLR